jgi:hypothetical protein
LKRWPVANSITDAITGQRIKIAVRSYPDPMPMYPQLAGRDVVTVTTANILTPDVLDGDTDDEASLTVEDAITLARRLLMGATAAMHRDPRTWRITRTDFDVLTAAVEANNADVEVRR